MPELTGTIYTETVVFSPPEAYVNDAPYQLAIIELESGRKMTARIEGGRASIGDRVVLVETRGDVQYFRKEQAERTGRGGAGHEPSKNPDPPLPLVRG